ncbi:Uncharacterised protein [Vibrio cholerae]|nr:Uncharacterised protein [Vibrio cholerae]
MTDMATSGHIDPSRAYSKSAGVFTGRLLEHHDRKAR